MRLCVVLAFLMAATTVQATEPVITFEQTVAAYERGEHDLARERFEQQSRLGFAEAQFNYGAMLLRGEGGDADRDQGLGWIALAAEQGYPVAEQAVEGLDLSSEQLAAYREPVADYNAQTLAEQYRLTEEACPESEANAKQFFESRSAVDDEEGIDPSSIIARAGLPPGLNVGDLSGAPGWVEVGYWIDEDGVPRDVHQVERFPPGNTGNGFVEVARWTRYKAEALPDRMVGKWVTTRTSKMSDSVVRSGPVFQQYTALRRKGDEDPLARFAADWMTYQVNLAGRPSWGNYLASVNAAARLGEPLAQRTAAELCPERGEFWLRRAAYSGDPNAQLRLVIRGDVPDALVGPMLEAAVVQGNTSAAVMRLRQLLRENPSERNGIARLMKLLPEDMKSGQVQLYAQAQAALAEGN